ncbi:hypothetical protein QZH41_019108, partial [Actinostola sp. cb2023]
IPEESRFNIEKKLIFFLLYFSLPKSVKRRIKALKNIQVECCKLEGNFYEEVHALECKYAEKFKPLYDKHIIIIVVIIIIINIITIITTIITTIIITIIIITIIITTIITRKSIANGNTEPTDEECIWPSEDEHEEDEEKEEKEEKDKTEVDQLSTDIKDKVTVDDDKIETQVLPEDTKGVPEFWLTSMKNVDMIGEMIQDHDEPILKHVTEIKVLFVGPDSNVDNSQYPLPTPMGFVLEFHFSPNPFFTNTILTKSYKMKCEPDEDDPFSFEGPEIIHSSGCKIDWKKGKNVTQKVVKKKQRHKGRGQTRFVNKTVKNDSFFNFFAPPEIQEGDEDMDEDTEALLAADFEIGHFFRERLIP